MDDLPLPDLELDEVALHGAAPASAPPWCVQIGAIRDPVESAGPLAEILGVDLGTASRIAVNAPGMALSGVPRAQAERVAQQIEGLGIEARAEAEGAPPAPSAPPGPSSFAPAAPVSHRPEPMAPTAPARSRESSGASGPGDSFWAQTPVAFMAPFLGKGSLLLLAAGVAGVGVAFITVAPGLFIKLGVVLALQLTAFGLFVEVFDRLAQAAIYRNEDRWLPEPTSDLPDAKVLFWRGLVNFIAFGILAVPSVLVAIYLRSVGAVIACQVLLFLYWPMGLTVHSISGRMTGALDILSVFRGISAAPLEYLTVCVLTFAAIGGSTAVVIAVTGASALAAGLTGGGIGTGAIVVAVLAFAWYAAIAYFHGVLGYLMGALVRSKSESFEFLQES